MFVSNGLMTPNAYGALTKNMRLMDTAATRLASGDKFSGGALGGAELGISDKYRMKMRSAQTLMATLEDGLGYTKTQETILNRIGDITVRMTELAAMAVDPQRSNDDRRMLNGEFRSLVTEIQRYQQNDIRYRGFSTFQQTFSLRHGFQGSDYIVLTSIDLRSLANTAYSQLYISNQTKASNALQSLQRRLGSLAVLQARAADHLNRLETTLSASRTFIANTQLADSAIRDTDVAIESAEFINRQVLVQAGQAMMAQNNSFSQNILRFYDL